MSAAQVARAMKAAGCTMEQIIAALEAIEETKLAKYRENNRLRQARHRARNASNADNASNAVTSVTSVTEHGSDEAPRARVLCGENIYITPNTPTGYLSPTGDDEPKRNNSRGTRLADDWRPSESDWRSACEKLGEANAATELEKMRDWAKSASGVKGVCRDWSARWRNWVRSAAERKPQQRPPPQSGRSLLAQLATGYPSNDLPADHHPPVIELNARPDRSGNEPVGYGSPGPVGEAFGGRLFDFRQAASDRR